jgi:hypothetical protein
MLEQHTGVDLSGRRRGRGQQCSVAIDLRAQPDRQPQMPQRPLAVAARELDERRQCLGPPGAQLLREDQRGQVDRLTALRRALALGGRQQDEQRRSD